MQSKKEFLNYFPDFATFASVAVNSLFLSEHIQRSLKRI